MSITGHRHEVLVRYNVTFDPEDGRILKSEFNAFSNAGYSVDLSLPWIMILLLR
jgi:xanthine dehydrogenase molybdopterin-binding subunit B